MSSTQQPAPARLVSQLLAEDPDLQDIVVEFVQGLPARLERLQQAFDHLEWKELTMLAHQLKGAGGSYGYPDISQLCAHMEASFVAHQAEDFGACFQQLSALVSAARAGLDQPT